MRARSSASATASPAAAASISSTISASSVRASSAARRIASAAPLSPATIAASISNPLGRVDRRRRLVLARRFERAADPLAEVGIADRDQPRQQQPAAARRTNASVIVRTARLLGSRMRPRRQPQRTAAEPRDQPRGERVGEGAMRGMVKIAGLRPPPSAIRDQLLRSADRFGVADVEPHALVDRAEAAPRRDRAVPEADWSKRARRARPSAAPSRPSGCR